MESDLRNMKTQQDVHMLEEPHDIEHDKQLVEEEQEITLSEGIDEEPQRRQLSVGMILTVALVAIAFFIALTYLPGLFTH